VPISQVLPDFHALPTEFTKIKQVGIIDTDGLNYLCKLAQQRFQIMYRTAHGLSFLLDPALLGEGLLGRNKRDLEDKLINTLADDFQPVDDARREMLYLQYTAFMIAVSTEKASKTFRYQLQVKGKKTPLHW
jgi:hypothetical protein